MKSYQPQPTEPSADNENLSADPTAAQEVTVAQSANHKKRDFKKLKVFNNVMTVVGLIATVLFFIYGYYEGIFVSEQALADFLGRFGVFAPIVFVLFQGLQVVIPVLPGNLGCLAGVIFFGPVVGFIYNYIGICAGSIVAFLLARKYGTGLVKALSSNKTFNKYVEWINYGKRFEKMFAIAIFLPVAPDDFLCLLAGTTKLEFKRFVLIILLGKPFGILGYSLGLALVADWLKNLLLPILGG